MEKLNSYGIQKDFYGKAIIWEYKGKIWLRSYDTVVASFEIETNVLRVNGTYSATTLRHIKAFMKHCGIPIVGKQDIKNLYYSKEL